MTAPIKFTPGRHLYRLDGKPVMGVTTLLSKGLPKPALVRWSANTVAAYVADNPDAVDQLRAMGREPMYAALKGIPWSERDKAAARGTEVHAFGEQVVHGTEVEVPEHIAGHVEGYVKFLDEHKVSPVLTEKMVANRQHWYAGTFDLVADIGGVRWLLDIKTSKGVYGETGLQLAAYRNAEFWQDDDGNEQPMPEVERLGVLHVREDGTTLIPFESGPKPFQVFLHVAWVAKQLPEVEQFAQTEDAA